MSVLFEDYCRFFKDSACQVLSLGAGYDANFFRLKATGVLPANCRYFEVDLPLVVANKSKVIQSSTELSSLVSFTSTPGCSEQYRLFSQDICDLRGLESALLDAGLDFNAPTLIFAECVLSYLDTKHSDALVEWTSSRFTHTALAVYEQVEPDDAFGIVMLKHFESLGSPLKSLYKYPDLLSVRRRYLTRGYDVCDCVGMADFVGRLDAEEARRFQGLEPFDEFEEWLEKCAHYAFTLARKGTVFEAFPTGFTQSDVAAVPRQKDAELAEESWTLRDADPRLRRFGHSSALTTDGLVLTAGGFAKNAGKHSRVFAPILTDPRTLRSEPVNLRLEGRQHFAMVCLDDGRVLVNGGRTSPLRACDSDVILRPSNGSYVADASNFKRAPPTRWRHSLAKVRDAEGCEKVVLFGGRSPDDTALGDCYVLDVAACAWSRVAESEASPSPRHSHAAVATHDLASVVITCGLSGNEKPLNCVHRFSIDTLTWEKLPVQGLLARFGHTAHLADTTTMLLVGGVSGACGNPCGLAVIDLVSMTCREVALPGQDPKRPFMTSGHTSVLVRDCDGGARVLVIGGGGNCFSFGTHFNCHVAVIDLNGLCMHVIK